MSSCLTGASRTYSFDLEFLRSPSTSSQTLNSPSPSSTLSESSNSRLAISIRKPRTPRKRLNQAYNEAASLLSTACPNIFPTKPYKFTKPNNTFFKEPSELLLPFRVIDDSGFLHHQAIHEKCASHIESRFANCEKPCERPLENDFQGDSVKLWDSYQEDFVAESILDDGIEDGVDSIMGNLNGNNGSVDEAGCASHPMGLGFGRNLDLGVWMRRGIRALRSNDEEDWWRFPPVNVLDISPKFSEGTTEKKKKKIEKPMEKSTQLRKGNPCSKFLLKLNYEDVLNAWSDHGTPFSKEIPSHEMSGNDFCVSSSSTSGIL